MKFHSFFLKLNQSINHATSLYRSPLVLKEENVGRGAMLLHGLIGPIIKKKELQRTQLIDCEYGIHLLILQRTYMDGGGEPSGKKCATYWSNVAIIKQGRRKEKDYPIDHDR